MSSFSKPKSRAFFEAARNGNLPLVKPFSLDPEVNLNWQDGFAWSPFFVACYRGHVDVVRYLLDFRDNYQRGPIDYNSGNNCGWTPFYAACWLVREKVVEMLLEDDKVDVNRANVDGQTPLWGASFLGRVGIVKGMLASTREIDTSKKDKNWNKTAAEIARQEGKAGVAQLIESYQKDPEGVKAQLRRELGYNVRLAGELFALVVYFSDGYLKLRERTNKPAERFFLLATSLPMELQIVLCNFAFDIPHPFINSEHSEKGFKKFSHEK